MGGRHRVGEGASSRGYCSSKDLEAGATERHSIAVGGMGVGSVMLLCPQRGSCWLH